MNTGAEDTSAEAFRPYRRLAIGVLALAVSDLIEPARSATDRESARVFLAGSGMLQHWCRVAALHPSWVVERVAKRATTSARSPASVADALGHRPSGFLPQEHHAERG
jgi:hypothetical protein